MGWLLNQFLNNFDRRGEMSVIFVGIIHRKVDHVPNLGSKFHSPLVGFWVVLIKILYVFLMFKSNLRSSQSVGKNMESEREAGVLSTVLSLSPWLCAVIYLNGSCIYQCPTKTTWKEGHAVSGK